MHPLIIISGPAGVGKTTVAKALLKTFPALHSSVTYTTRRRREFSTEDKKMYYVSRPEFERRRDAGEFLEWATVHGDYYGTHREETLAVLNHNPVIFNIDVQGAEQLMKQFGRRAVSVFLLPESHEQMVDHIKNRGEMTEGDFQARLKSAERELTAKDRFDYQVINAEGRLNETMDKIAGIIKPYLLRGEGPHQGIDRTASTG
ncbi:MAG: guanylate kinase [Candidatus Magasanikbacteria bacterium]|nr:guanylate kinase [Candidatus Magasanikbacteria bacterium]